MNAWIFFVLAFAAYLLIRHALKIIKDKRQAYIQAYSFRPKLLEKLSQHYPHLTELQQQQVQQGLRHYFKRQG